MHPAPNASRAGSRSARCTSASTIPPGTTRSRSTCGKACRRCSTSRATTTACGWWCSPVPAARRSCRANISQFEDMRAAREAVAHYEAMAEATLTAIQDFSKPTLACIRGYCIGGGVNVAIGCDIRIASTDSIFSIPAARLGLGYRYSAMKNLVDLIGPGAAKDLFFTARRIDAVEAKALGLVTRVCPPDTLDALLAEYTAS